MKIKILLILFLAFIWHRYFYVDQEAKNKAAQRQVVAQPTNQVALNTKEGCEKWLNTYYKNPEPNRLGEALKCFSKVEISDKYIPGFLAGLFNKNPGKINNWVDEIKSLGDNRQISDKYLQIVGTALSYAGIENAQSIMTPQKNKPANINQAFGANAANKKSNMLENLPIEKGPQVVNALWGKFLATGESAPIEKIIQALPLANSQDASKNDIGNMAFGTLQTGASKHPRVREIISEQMGQKQSPEINSKLQMILSGIGATK